MSGHTPVPRLRQRNIFTACLVVLCVVCVVFLGLTSQFLGNCSILKDAAMKCCSKFHVANMELLWHALSQACM